MVQTRARIPTIVPERGRHRRPSINATPCIRRAVSAAFGVLLAACGDDSNNPSPRARYAFREALTADLMRLEITSPAGLTQAAELLSSGEARWVLGIPRPGDGGFNTPWSWHLDPASISFAEITIEACQTAMAAIDDDLDYWIGFGQVCIQGVVDARED